MSAPCTTGCGTRPRLQSFLRGAHSWQPSRFLPSHPPACNAACYCQPIPANGLQAFRPQQTILEVLDPRGGGKGARLSGAAASQEMRGRSGAHSRSHCRTCIPRTSIAKLTLDAMLRARRFAAAVEGRRRVQEQLAQGERIVAELAREDDVLGGTSYAPAQLARRGADEPADLVVPQCRRKEKRSLSRSAEAKQRDAEMFKISSVRADANSEAGLSMREQSKDRLQSIEDAPKSL
jgi:hypothetical protein